MHIRCAELKLLASTLLSGCTHPGHSPELPKPCTCQPCFSTDQETMLTTSPTQAQALLSHQDLTQAPTLDGLGSASNDALVHVQGVPAREVAGAVAEVVARVSLPPEMAVRPAGQLSGGNKRKLALGIALVGGTSALLLDEPSSGMACPSACKHKQQSHHSRGASCFCGWWACDSRRVLHHVACRASKELGGLFNGHAYTGTACSSFLAT